MMMIMLGWLVIATALFLLRPSSLRNHGDGKPSPSGVSHQDLISFLLSLDLNEDACLALYFCSFIFTHYTHDIHCRN